MPVRRSVFAALLCLTLLFARPALGLVQITGTDDLDFGTWSGGGLSRTLSVCIYNDAGPNSSYAITAEGEGPGSAFTVHRGSIHVGIDIDWSASGGGWQGLTPRTRSGIFSGASNVLDCGGGSNASIRFTVNQTDLLNAYAGDYSGLISFELVPQ